MASSRRMLASLLLASTTLAAVPAVAQDAERTELAAVADDAAEIVITGRFIPDEKRETSAIVSVLGAAELERGGDGDIAASLTRVTGLSLVGGRFVYVRGLGGRYSSAILDGSVLPSPEPLRRVVPLDVFPTDLLDGALIQKTYSVEYPGEFGGGLIALRSKSVPEENFFEFGISTGFNDESTFEDGLSFKGGAFDNVGFGDETYELPTAVSTNPSLDGFDPGQLQVAGRSLVRRGPGFSLDREANAPDLGINATLGQHFGVGGMSAGALLAVSFKSETRNKFGVRNRYSPAVNNSLGIFSSFSPEACAGFAVDASSCGLFQTDQTVTLGVIGSLGLDIDSDNRIKATSVLLRKTDKIGEIQRGQTPINDTTNVVSDQQLAFIEQELWTNQLSGEHKFTMGGAFSELAVNWRGAYARASRTTPFRTEYRYIISPTDTQFHLSPLSSRFGINFTALTDDNYEGGLDLALKGEIAGMETVLKVGGLYNKKDRGFASRRYSFIYPSNIAQLGELLSYVPEIIFSPDNIGPGGFVLDQTDGPANSFTAATEIYGSYVSAELQLTDQVRITGGVRYEKSQQQVSGAIAGTLAGLGGDAAARCVETGTTAEFTTPIFCRLDTERFLPAGAITWEFADNMQLRFGYSRTLSRPDLRELSPAVIFNIEDGLEEQGNPGLRITSIDNFDGRYEWYFGNKQLLSLGGFYKKLSNPIERSLSPFGDGGRRIFINAQSAKVYGGEVELEVTLPFGDWIGGEFLADRRVFLIGNFTYAKSDVRIGPDQVGVLTNPSRRLEGQSEILGNLQFGYEREGERMAVLFNYAGDRISDVGTFGLPDVIENPPITLDFTFAKTLPIRGRDVELSFKANNLLADDFRRSQGGLVYEQYDLGRSFSLGVKTRF